MLAGKPVYGINVLATVQFLVKQIAACCTHVDCVGDVHEVSVYRSLLKPWCTAKVAPTLEDYGWLYMRAPAM